MFMLMLMLKLEIIAMSMENTEVKLNHKIYNIFHNLKNYGSHLIKQELGKFSFTINVITNALQKCMSFRINTKSIFIDSF